LAAWLGDRVLGKTRTVTIGCLLMSAGHLAMASEALFLVALGLIILGAGGVIGNMAAQVGALYARADHRRTRAFGVYLITLNMGALAAPLVIGTLGERAGWHYGFNAAGVGMIIGLATYLAGRRHLPPDVIASRTVRADRAKLSPAELRRVGAIFAMLVPYTVYNAVLNQAYAVMYVWADTHVDRMVAGWEVPVTWIGVIDGLFTILGVIAASRIWARQHRRGSEPGDLTKTAIGYGLITAGYLWVAAIATLPAIPVLLWIGFYVLIDFGAAYVEPPIQALVSRDAPAQVSATMMAVLKATGMLAYFLLGWLGRFYEPLGPTRFWLLHAALIAGSMLMLLLGRSWLLRLLGRTEQAMEAG
jgi:POT family proton-dependent oligopeptide transporter